MSDKQNTVIIFDEDFYYGEQGEKLARENLLDQGIEDVTKSQIFDEAMELKSLDFEDAISELKVWFDKGIKNPNAGNHILVAGSASRWNGTSSGIMIYSDFSEAIDTSPSRFRNKSIFADCEFSKIWEEDGRLYLSGYHHDGGVTVEMRQLSNEGEKLLNKTLDYEGEADLYDLKINVMGKTYVEGDENKLVHDIWNDPDLCPKADYAKKAIFA